MSDAYDRIVGPLRDKLPDVRSSTELTESRWKSAEATSTDEFKLEIQLDDEASRSGVVDQLERKGITVGSDYGRVIKTKATAEQVFDVAETDHVEKVFEELPTKIHATSEGVGVSNADTVQSDGITGSGVKTAIIDLNPGAGGGFWPESHTDYGGNVVDKIQSGDPQQTSYFVESDQMHGTGCTEIIHDMAPNADLVLLAYRGSDNDGDIVSMLKQIEQQHPDTAVVSISLGSAPTNRLDGKDDTSEAIETFTNEGETISDPTAVDPAAERGRVCAISAGNEADGNVWHGQYEDSGDGTMVFEDGETYLEIQDVDAGAFVIANWDSWDEGSQTYSIALYEDSAKTTEVTSNSPNTDWSYLSIPSGRGGETLYFEVTQESASRDHEFDIWLWGSDSDMRFTKSKPDRSISIPATTRDSHTLTTAAIQATNFGVEPSAGDVKVYSSRGPTRDGRDGIEIAGPSRVTQTSQGYGTASSTADPAYGFNGTSAAAPHVAGAATLLFELDGVDHTDVAAALQNTGAGIPDSNVDKSDTTIVGGGYLDVQAAKETLSPELDAPLSTKWTSADLGGRAQFNTPAVDSQQVYVGGLQKTFYALSVDDGTSVGWTFDRGSKPGLSDSSGYRWNDQIFFGSGQGKLYGLDADDSTRHWSSQDTPDLGSAITSSPAVSNSTVFVGTNDGTVYAFDASTASQQWSQSVGGPVYSDLAAADGLVYVTTRDGDLVVLDATDGSEQWRASFSSFGASSPTLGGGRVYVASDEVYAFDAAASKSQLWSSTGYGGTAGSNPTFDSGTIYVGSSDGSVYALDATNGSESWSYATGDAVAATPAVDDTGTRIAVASTDGTLYLLDDTGSELDTMSIPTGTRSSPTISNGAIYLGAPDGVVYAFE
ncbi:outer membrane protein assembly factor BamB family protein [Halapricum salinum]|uniref:Peptidase S8/S53 domain-containing protein n=1 Tax=Halapricum salinum TaxID=1457250 RepID=A0A4D6HDS8_9EURY|nr:PQQ-binding-like beta-propeller repeat protein [Halapricum salinum]QCC51745.1 hypothetical protein DV733_11080 [Halapricum salinum]